MRRKVDVLQRRVLLDAWFKVEEATVRFERFDGTTYRSYVGGMLQAEAPIAFRPHGAGRASVGMRINRVSYFKGAVLWARLGRSHNATARPPRASARS